MATQEEEAKEWEDELKRLQSLLPFEAARNKLRDEEIPALEQQIKEDDDKLPSLAEKAEKACVHVTARLSKLNRTHLRHKPSSRRRSPRSRTSYS
jgi:hypothetical protein